MHNSLEVHALLIFTPVRDRTFRYENGINDIQTVVGEIADKIEKMYETRERMAFGFKREFAESEEAGETERGRERTPKADSRARRARRARREWGSGWGWGKISES